jgi:hypothetical protein
MKKIIGIVIALLVVLLIVLGVMMIKGNKGSTQTTTETSSNVTESGESGSVQAAETFKVQESELDNDFETLEIESEYVVELDESDDGLEGALAD